MTINLSSNSYDLINTAKSVLADHKRLLAHMDSRWQKLPFGSLDVRIRNDNEYYYHSIRRNGKRELFAMDSYGADAEDMIAALKEKSIITSGRPTIRNNISLLENLISNFDIYDPSKFKYGAEADTRLSLENEVCLENWLSEPWEQSNYMPENRIFKTASGIYVRSKSEAMICDIATEFNLHPRYECRVDVGGMHFYPDFMFPRLCDRKIVLMEHLGMLDNPDYAQKSIQKLTSYPMAGFYLGYNLMVTWETRDNPLTRDKVVQVFRDFHII